ncbi:hypothetical protein K438DRAFT_1767546 [Mycena galopus ATCC 62051]|nr:hypothetical protein K438DRAFT_1767546 [Mycena galopus ATCC 62051]
MASAGAHRLTISFEDLAPDFNANDFIPNVDSETELDADTDSDIPHFEVITDCEETDLMSSMNSKTVQSTVKPQNKSTVVDMCKADLSAQILLCELLSIYAGHYMIHQDDFIFFSNRGTQEVKKVVDLCALVSEGVMLLCEILMSAVEGESNSESLKIEVEPMPT